jgi:hypothetical protein
MVVSLYTTKDRVAKLNNAPLSIHSKNPSSKHAKERMNKTNKVMIPLSAAVIAQQPTRLPCCRSNYSSQLANILLMKSRNSKVLLDLDNTSLVVVAVSDRVNEIGGAGPDLRNAVVEHGEDNDCQERNLVLLIRV